MIHFDDLPDLRPTPQRVRETLFNWLQPVILGSRCLDLFSGSGALGFEAASRGAKSVTQVENNLKAYQRLKTNTEVLKAGQISVIQADAMHYLTGPASAYDVVFLDPPFANDCAEQVCHLLEQHKWLNADALCYVEAPANRPLKAMPANWELAKSKSAGDVAYYLFSRAESAH